MEKKLKTLVLAALLHDIGKFAQRANRPFSKEMEGEYLTDYKGRLGHWHTVYTDYFVENDLPLPSELEDSRSKIARIASAHHRPDEADLAEMSIMIADRLSSGADRIEEQDPEMNTGFRESRLISIFEEIELISHEFVPPGNSFHNLVPLTTGSECIFPVAGPPKGNPKDYAPLFDQFLSEVRAIDNTLDFGLYFDNLISILEKYTWCVPSASYKTLPDVSLFDHAFSTAGIAQAIYLFHKKGGPSPGWNDKQRKFALVGGDISGIQDYIFGVNRSSGKGVTKIFRARSFYLQALSRSIVLEIQKRLMLYSVCRIMDSGGKFILLVPNVEGIQGRFESLDDEIQRFFRNKFKGLLTLNLSWETLISQEDLFLLNFQTKMDEMNKTLEKSKFRKLRKTIAESGPVIDGGYDEHEEGNCALCAINAADESSTRRYNESEGLSIPICTDCCEQIDYIGTRLPNHDFLVYGAGGRIPLFGDIGLTLSRTPPADLRGVLHIESLCDSGRFRRVRLARHLPRLTKEEIADENWFNIFAQEIESLTPEKNQPKTFGMIAAKSKREKKDAKEPKTKLMGRSLLGFLKADVDNLGLIFSQGFGQRMSVARFSSLSRMLDLFFSDYLVELVKNRFPDIYVVFAGGDDLFLVGPWWQTIRFAIEMRKKLSLFCAKNPDITLSGAVLTARPRLPMRKAVEIVEDDLDHAKDVKKDGKVKDSICFLGETYSWNELENLVELGEKFSTALDEKDRTNFSMAFLYRLLEYHRMYKKFVHEKNISFGRYLSLAHYDIGRNIRTEKTKNEEEVLMLYDIFRVGAQDRTSLENLNVPLFYSINLNRE